MTSKIVTANSLRIGEVVYLDDKGGWSPWVDEARVSRTESDAEEMIGLAKKAHDAAIVVEPYLIDVTVDGGTVKPVRWREQIRASGPPVHPALGKQAVRR